MDKDKRRKKIISIFLFLLFLLMAQETVLWIFGQKDSLILQFQNKYLYSSAINQGIKFYTSQKTEKLKIDEYLLLKEISRRERDINLSDLMNKYESNPFKRILNRENYSSNLSFDRSGFGKNSQHPPNNPLYELSSPYNLFLEESWDDVVLRSLYCDISGYDDTDFSVLKSIKKGDGGYWDTHALLGLILLERNMCYDQQKISEQIAQVAENIILAEQQDKIFSDLYAERIVFLYWAGYGQAVKKEWTDIVRDNLTRDPGWRTGSSFSSNAHTSGLALLSMIYYKEGKDSQSFYN